MAEDYSGVKPVDSRHQLDVEKLSGYLRTHIDGLQGRVAVEQFKGGQSNPTYRLTAADGRRFVLRRKPPGKLLPSAHAVDREFRVIKALHGAGFPVAKPYMLCEDDAVLGTAFYVMDCVDGRVIWDQSLSGMSKAERGIIYGELNRVIAQLHTIDYKAIGLEDYGRPGNYVARQVDRWTKQYRASETQKLEAMDRLIEWLPKNVPPGDETSIVHGDYRLDNVMFHSTEPRVLAVLDWELSTLGHPLADFAYHALAWHVPGGIFRGISELPLAELGIPSEQDYVAAYCRRTGRAEIPRAHWDYYIAYNLFRLAAILQGIAKRAIDGTAANSEAENAGKRAGPLAELGWTQVEKILARG